MGVTGLWALLEPVGRRINIESLTNKRVAVDASIWLVQFIKAMRDEQGELVRNAHLLGFFRRICRLLFHRVRPVFVFDGATPAIKRRTVIARRQQREQAGAKLRKTAEKLLLSRLKQHALETLGSQPAATTEPVTKKRKATKAKVAATIAAEAPIGAEAAAAPQDLVVAVESGIRLEAEEVTITERAQSSIQSDESAAEESLADAATGVPLQKRSVHWADDTPDDTGTLPQPDTRHDAELAAQLAGEYANEPEASTATATGSRLDPGAGPSCSPPASGLRVPAERRGPGIAVAFDALREAKLATEARSIARAEAVANGGVNSMAISAVAAAQSSSEDDSDDEMILMPQGIDQLDPAVLSTLPQSMQFELLVKMRERLQNVNREQFAERQGKPAEFSVFQMQTFLKVAEHKRQIDVLRDTMNGKAGSNSSSGRHIAGEQGREYFLHDANKLPVEDAEPEGPSVGSDPLEISFDLPTGTLTGERVDEEGDDVEWETMDADGKSAAVPNGSLESSFMADASGVPRPKDWQERMKQRQKFWSLSHGFKGGRKLAEWSMDGAEEGKPADDEEAELQLAIELSMAEAAEEPPPASPDLLDLTDDVEEQPKGRNATSQSLHTLVSSDEENEWEDVLPADTSIQPTDTDTESTVLNPPAGSTMVQPTSAARPLAFRQQEGCPPQLLSPRVSESEEEWEPELEQLEPVKGGVSAAAAIAATIAAAADVKAVTNIGTVFHSPEAAMPKQAEPANHAAPDALENSKDIPAPSAVPGSVDGSPAKPKRKLMLPAIPNKSSALPKTAPVDCTAPASIEGDSEAQLQPEASLQPLTKGLKPKRTLKLPPTPGQLLSAQHSKPHSTATATPADITQHTENQVSARAGVDSLPELVTDANKEEEEMDWEAVASPQLEVALAVPSVAVKVEPLWLPSPEATTTNRSALDPVPSRMPDKGEKKNIAELEDDLGVDSLPVKSSISSPSLIEATGMSALEVGAGALTNQVSAGEDVPKQRRRLKRLRDSSVAEPTLVATAPFNDDPAPDTAASVVDEERLREQLTAGTGVFASQGDDDEDNDDFGSLAAMLESSAAVPATQADYSTGTGVFASQTADDDASDFELLAAVPSAATGDQQYTDQFSTGSGSVEASASVPAFDIDAELASLEVHQKELQKEHRRHVAGSEAPTSEMYGECQELLQLFGLPYIIAPMEAEAQCAWLNTAGLVDGVVTDDNDVFLFGAAHVYRNIFESKKYVEEYRASDITSELGLDRMKLVRMAQLLGSDYSPGVGGIGVVNAVEVVNAFEGEGGLQRFKDWALAPGEDLIASAPGTAPSRGRRASRGRGRGRGRGKAKSKGSAEGDSVQDSDAEEAGNDDSEIMEPGRIPATADEEEPAAARHYKTSHRGARKNWEIPGEWPNPAVEEAYVKPRVDDAQTRFTYGRPDVELLQRFCWDKFGWDQEKVDELLGPVLKAHDNRSTQRTLDSFLSFNQRFAKIQSKRLARAVRGIAGEALPEEILLAGNEEVLVSPRPRKGPSKGRSTQADHTSAANLSPYLALALSTGSEAVCEDLAATEAPSTRATTSGRGQNEDAVLSVDGGRGRKKTAKGKGRGRGGKRKA